MSDLIKKEQKDSKKKITFSVQNLLQLFHQRKENDFKFYIAEISEQNEEVEDIVVFVLHQILIAKKNVNPSKMLSALIFYKSLMLSAELDFYEEDDLFSAEIHHAVAKICEYKGTQPLKNRGENYFVDMFKEDPSYQKIGKIGNTFVTLALEIVQSMATWYPKSYLNGKKSIHLLIYEELLKKKVIFPKKEEYSVLSPSDEQEFLKNQKSFMEIIQENQSPNNSHVKQVIHQNMIQKEPNSKILKVIERQVQKPTLTPQKQQKKDELPIIKDVLKSKFPDNLEDREGANLKSKLNNSDQVVKEKKQQAIIAQKKQQQVVQSNIQGSHHNDKTIFAEKAKEVQKKFSSNEAKKLIGLDSPKKIIQIKKQVKNQNINNPTLNKSKQKEQNVSPIQEISQRQHETQNKNNKIVETIGNSNLQINYAETAKQNQNYFNKRIFKIEKPINHKEKHVENKQQVFKNDIVKRKCSLPKTQKNRLILTTFERGNLEEDFQNQNKFGSVNISPENKQNKIMFGQKTLSYFRSCKKRQSQDYFSTSKSGASLLETINSFNLNKTILPFVPEYFSPLTLQMFSLRDSALSLWNFSQLSHPFFGSKLIEARLIKSGNNVYILTIQNISNDLLNISLVDQSKARFSNRIQILNCLQYRNSPYKLQRRCFFDIKFQFSTFDFNFKFLLFLLDINGKFMPLTLPITLLDTCKITQYISIEQIQQYGPLYGRILSSEPFPLKNNSIPAFMIASRVENTQSVRKKVGNSQLIGQCYLLMNKIDSFETSNQLNIFIKLVDSTKLLYQINILYDCRTPDNQDLGKVMLQLLMFLLKG